MKAQEIIRSVLDLIDDIEAEQEPTDMIAVADSSCDDDEFRRFQQIVNLTQPVQTQHANEPAEAYGDLASVTVAAGGGVNGPKNPADMRSNSISMYPDYQAHKGS